MADSQWESYELHARKLMERAKVPGGIVAVAVDGKAVYTKGLGHRDVEAELPVDEQTIFGIGSVTKSFAALGIMQLHESGKLSVGDPVVKYLPEFRFGQDGAEQSMTIHHFLTHTSGIPPLGSLHRTLLRSLQKDVDTGALDKKQGEALAKMEPIDTSEQLISYIAGLDLEPLGYPGEYFSYSNDAYALLGEIIARASGKTYEQYTHEHILEPLGMEHSSFDCCKTDNVATLFASRREKRKTVVYPAPLFWEAPSMAAAGFLRSTARDMLRYMEIYRTGGMCGGRRLLSACGIEQMCTPYVRTPNYSAYGYGLMIHPNYKGVSLVEHGGNIKGVSAYVSCIRERGITGVALTNFGSGPGGDLLLGAMNVLLDVPLGARRFHHRTYDLATERLPRYAGAYASAESTSPLNVLVDKQRLVLELEGAKLKARPIGLDAFAIKLSGQELPLQFLAGTNGEIDKVHIGFRVMPRVKPAAADEQAQDEAE